MAAAKRSKVTPEWWTRLRARASAPRAWLDDSAPWADRDFSRWYAKTGSLGPGRARREALFLAPWVTEGGRALDLGCGAGRTALALAREGVPVVGVDVGEGALELAREAGAGLACTFERRDLSSDELPPGPFALAYAIDGTLAGFRRPAAVAILGAVADRLSTGGRVVLELPTPAMAEALDLRQDWYLTEESAAGPGPQLVLTEDFFLREGGAYVHRQACVDVVSGAMACYVQTYALYDLENAEALVADAGLVLEEARGDFGPDQYAPGESHRLVLILGRP
jgi:SAM-dependent methyltransferase